jgi:peptidoglycan/LPS O-acetylase OafA/YrhL
MINQQNQVTERYAYIDVLRGLAALMVVYLHTSEIFLNPALHIDSMEHGILDS